MHTHAFARTALRSFHKSATLASGHNKCTSSIPATAAACPTPERNALTRRTGSKIKHSKGAADAERAKLFSRLSNDIAVAAKIGGEDPAFNIRLAAVLTSAKKADMPKSNVEAALKRASGRASSGASHAVTYEANLASVGFIVDALTDNKVRTVANVKSMVKKAGGTVSPAGFLFDHIGSIKVAQAAAASMDHMTNLAIEAGADDVLEDRGVFEFVTEPANLNMVATALKEHGLELLTAELRYKPKELLDVSEDLQMQVTELIDHLEADDDVVRVTCNVREVQA